MTRKGEPQGKEPGVRLFGPTAGVMMRSKQIELAKLLPGLVHEVIGEPDPKPRKGKP